MCAGAAAAHGTRRAAAVSLAPRCSCSLARWLRSSLYSTPARSSCSSSSWFSYALPLCFFFFLLLHSFFLPSFFLPSFSFFLSTCVCSLLLSSSSYPPSFPSRIKSCPGGTNTWPGCWPHTRSSVRPFTAWTAPAGAPPRTLPSRRKRSCSSSKNKQKKRRRRRGRGESKHRGLFSFCLCFTNHGEEGDFAMEMIKREHQSKGRKRTCVCVCVCEVSE